MVDSNGYQNMQQFLDESYLQEQPTTQQTRDKLLDFE